MKLLGDLLMKNFDPSIVIKVESLGSSLNQIKEITKKIKETLILDDWKVMSPGLDERTLHKTLFIKKGID